MSKAYEIEVEHFVNEEIFLKQEVFQHPSISPLSTAPESAEVQFCLCPEAARPDNCCYQPGGDKWNV